MIEHDPPIRTDLAFGPSRPPNRAAPPPGAAVASASASRSRGLAHALLVIGVGLGVGGLEPDPGATATVAAEPSPCDASATRIAAPDDVPLGRTTVVTATIAIRCPDAPLPLDVVLVIDRSPSMKGAPLEDAKAGAAAFVDGADLSRNRIGVVSFSDVGDVEAELTHDSRYLRSAIAGLRTPAVGGTDVAAGLRSAGRMLDGERSRPDAAPVLVLLSDARNGLGGLPVTQQARLLREAGVHLITIALGIAADRALMSEIASTPEDALATPDSADLIRIFERIAGGLVAIGARDVVVSDRLDETMAYVSESSHPPAAFDGRNVEWRLGVLGPEPRALRIELRPTRLGRWPTSASAELAWIDSLGRAGWSPIPIPFVDVHDPLAGPSPRPTDDGTATRTPAAPSTPDVPAPPTAATGGAPATPPDATPAAEDGARAFLPVAFRDTRGGGPEPCDRAGDPIEVVLVIDSSTTMALPLDDGRTRLEAARAAAGAFGERTIEAGGTVGLVTFDAAARILVAPTDDRGRLALGLDAITIREGSRLDLGLRSGAEAFGGARDAVLVVLTDGRIVGATDEAVEDAAGRTRADGVEVWAIALGADADGLDLLRRVAGHPERLLGDDGDTGLESAFETIFRGAVCP